MSRSPQYDRGYRRSVSRSRSRSLSSRSRSFTPDNKRGRSPSPRRRGGRGRISSSRSRSRSFSPPQRRGGSRGGRRYGRRSRSRSHSPREYRRRGRRSRSPMSNRKRHQGNRFNPNPSRVLGVFGLSLYTGEKDVRDLFDRYGQIDRVQVVYDHQTGRSRGFSFVYFADVEDAVDAKENCNGMEVDGRKIRVDYSITKRPHTPTPGVYMGRPTRGSPDENHSGRSGSSGGERGKDKERH